MLQIKLWNILNEILEHGWWLRCEIVHLLNYNYAVLFVDHPFDACLPLKTPNFSVLSSVFRKVRTSHENKPVVWREEGVCEKWNFWVEQRLGDCFPWLKWLRGRKTASDVDFYLWFVIDLQRPTLWPFKILLRLPPPKRRNRKKSR